MILHSVPTFFWDIQSSSTFGKAVKGRRSKKDASSSNKFISYTVIGEKTSETQQKLTKGNLEVDLRDKRNSTKKLEQQGLRILNI